MSFGRFCFIAILFLILAGGLDFVFLVPHEEVHQKVYDRFGCDDIEVEYSLSWVGMNGKTRCVSGDNSGSVEEYSLHLQNDIITYNLQHVVAAVFTAALLIITYLEIRTEDEG